MPKGHTNNPNGRPKNEDCAAYAIRQCVTREDWERAARNLITIAQTSPDGKMAAAAYNAIADRAYGRAVQKQIVQEEMAPPVDQETLDKIQDTIMRRFEEQNGR